MSTTTDKISRGVVKQHPNTDTLKKRKINRITKDATKPKLPAVIPRAAVVSVFLF